MEISYSDKHSEEKKKKTTGKCGTDRVSFEWSVENSLR